MNEVIPAVSVVIPVFNAEKDITRCLKSLQKISAKLNIEVIMVDNNSEDQTLKCTEGISGVKVLKEKRQGAAHARNRGWRAARAPYVAFIDSDCAAHPAWIEDLLPELEADSSLAGVGGTVITGSLESTISQYIEFRKLLCAEIMAIDDWFSPPFLLTCNAIYRKDVLEKLGGFSDLWPCEDADFSFRCKEAGYGVKQFSDKGIVYHYHRTTTAGLGKMMRSYGAGGAEVFLLHRDNLPDAPFNGKLWIEWANYLHLLIAIAKLPLSLREDTDFHRRRAWLDILTHGNLIIGRWKTALRKKALTL